MAAATPEGQDREVPQPLETALELLVYVPVGLAITAAEELPKLAAKGRARVDTQVTMARVVGQFAVAQGRKQLEKHWSQMAPPTPPSADEAEVDEAEINYEDLVGGNGQAPYAPPGDPYLDPPPAAGQPAPPRADELAIPGYDSLSASQVVQRLAGLSREELAAVGAYERAHRARRTILNRIGQLQGQ